MVGLTLVGDETRSELIVALMYRCAHAKRQQCIVGTLDHPSEWDKAHWPVDELLDLVVGL